MPSDAAAIAVDVGGTTIKAVAALRDGSALHRVVAPTFRSEGDALSTLVEVVGELAGALAADDGGVVSIGVACPGLVDPVTGTVELAANLGWRGIELVRQLEDRFAVPVTVDNDARTGAAAELAARDARPDQVFVPIGTGVSAAIAVHGELLRGTTNSAGEFGHLRIVPDGERCTCGAHGCIEAYSSAWAIVARYRRVGQRRAESARDVLALVPQDPAAATVWSEAVDALAVGLASLASLTDPARIVIGGGLSLAGEALMAPLRDAVAGYLPWRPAPEIAASGIGSASALAGAALRAWAPNSPADFVDRLSTGITAPIAVAS